MIKTKHLRAVGIHRLPSRPDDSIKPLGTQFPVFSLFPPFPFPLASVTKGRQETTPLSNLIATIYLYIQAHTRFLEVSYEF
jgi:hypothetical protein